jgi:hypothetical protein
MAGIKISLAESQRMHKERKPFGYKTKNTLFFLCGSSDPKGSGCEAKVFVFRKEFPSNS